MFAVALFVREVVEEPYGAAPEEKSTELSSVARSAEEDPDFIEDLADEIAIFAAHLHAGTQPFLLLIAKFDRLRGWERFGQPDCARWLAVRTGVDLHTAREQVRTARALAGLPLTSAAMGRGELSFSQLRAVTRAATAENEASLLDVARHTTARQLERMMRSWKKGSRQDETERERERHASRTLSVFPDDEGMYVIRGKLDPEVGALLMRTIEAASDALHRERPVPDAGGDSQREAAQRRADAIGLLAERALAAGFGAESGAPETPISGTRAERYQVVLHVEAETLAEDCEAGRSDLEDGTRVSAETSRRLACDASVIIIAHHPDHSVLDIGRKTRTIPPPIRRALEVRDRGCRFPGCGSRFCDAHHLRHWADGGETSLTNCLLLCRFHHRLVHEGGWRVEWWGVGRPVFFDQRGGTFFDGRWEPPQLPDQPAEALLRGNLSRDVNPDAWTASAPWESERDIPNGVYFRASERF